MRVENEAIGRARRAGHAVLGRIPCGAVPAARGAVVQGPGLCSPEEDEEAIADLDVDDIQIDEANLPRLDIEDPETLALEQEHDDLLDRRWLERPETDDDSEERSALDDLGVTIELNASGAEDEAEEVDLDIGDLLEPLPGDGSDGDPSLGHERDSAFGVAALHDMLLPESEEEQDGRDVGDDERFPVFDDGAPAWRPVQGDDDSPEGEPS